MSSLDLSLDEKYKLLYNQIKSLISKDEPVISNLSNITGAIKQTFEKISWVGFYFTLNDNLFLGPFQGLVACSKIKIGHGVCGTAAIKKQTQVVPNVHEFPGHIACDAEANSEIVVPILHKNLTIAVLDVDSREFEAFNETDKIWFENICKLIADNLNLEKLFSTNT